MREMTPRERMEAVIEGKMPDKIPWVPRLNLWYNFHKNEGTLPERYKNFSKREIEEDLGMGMPAHPANHPEIQSIMDLKLSGKAKMNTYKKNRETILEYITPKGKVRSKRRVTAETAKMGAAPEITEHMIKDVDDYSVVEYIVEHTEVVPTYERFLDYRAKVGEAGIPMTTALIPPPLTGEWHCPMHKILRELIGYQKAYVHLHRYQNKFLHLLKLITGKAKEEMWNVILQSPAKLIEHGSHINSELTPPPIFKKYFLPYFQEFAEKLHAVDKKLVFHLDADTTNLLQMIRDSGCDLADCFVTAPQVSMTLEEARKVWGNKIVILGGIPSTILIPSFPREKFERYMAELFEIISPGKSIILGVADNILPDAKFQRIEDISNMIATFGKCPIDVSQNELRSFFNNKNK